MKKHSHAIGGLSLCLGFVLALPLASPARGAVKGIAAANAGARCDAPALPLASAAPGAVFTVITAADTDDGKCDSSTCSLRDAIKAANASPGTDTIRFSVGSGVMAIQPASPLPAITDSVTIDGTSQPGYSGAPLIVLDGRNSVSTGLVVQADNSLIRGLVVCQFIGDGIQIFGGGNYVQASYVGTDPSGASAKANGGRGVLVSGSGNTVGGENPGDGNVISGNGGDGVRVSGGSNNFVRGNRIGTDATGTSAIGNGGSGVTLDSTSSNQVGCTVTAARNVISGNAVGVFVTGSDSAGNLIGANFIGTDAAGGSGIGNLNDGVLIASGASRNAVGGAGGDSSNKIAFNRGNGITARGDAGAGNLFRNNAIFANGGLGIDLGADGPTPNHGGPSSSGPNNFQNFPVLSSVSSAGGNTTISGSLEGVASGKLTLEFFVNDARDHSGFGQGQIPIGTSDVTADGSGRATFAASFPMNLLASQVVTATATDTSDDTSEFSAGIQLVMNFFTVDPCRAVDTRGSDGPGIDGLSVRTFTIAGRCGIPSTAKSVSFNVTITQPDAGGFLTLYPAGTGQPVASMINYRNNETRANNAVIPLGPNGDIAVFNGQPFGTAHLILDVNGYFQ